MVEAKPHAEGRISIWFFIGTLLLAYGILILGSGIYEWIRPSELQVVLANLHAGVWWGILLLILGAVYCVRFFPGKNSSDV
jgi:hypothetical protein